MKNGVFTWETDLFAVMYRTIGLGNAWWNSDSDNESSINFDAPQL